MEAVEDDAAGIDANREAVDELENPSRPVRARFFLQPGEGRLYAGAPTVLVEVGHRRLLAPLHQLIGRRELPRLHSAGKMSQPI
jgi:hypothetical protein